MFTDPLLRHTPLEQDGERLPARSSITLGTGITATDDPDSDTTHLTVDVSAAGGISVHVADQAAMRAYAPEPETGTEFLVGSDPVPWSYDRSTGAGFAGDGQTIDILDSTSIGAPVHAHDTKLAPCARTAGQYHRRDGSEAWRSTTRPTHSHSAATAL